MQRETESAAIRHIRTHAHFDVILASIREGIALAEIARQFAHDQLLTVTEGTFLEYLYTYHRQHKSEIYAPQAAGERFDMNRKLTGRAPGLDVDQELDRAIRFQKIRVGLGFTNEQTLGLPLEQVGRDVITLGKLLELKVKRNALGSLGKSGAQPMLGPLEAPTKVREELDKVSNSEQATDKLVSLTATLMRELSGA